MEKPNATPEIQVTGLTIGYDTRVLMENLEFDVRRGEIFFIMGGSGCGKSTLLKHLRIPSRKVMGPSALIVRSQYTSSGNSR